MDLKDQLFRASNDISEKINLVLILKHCIFFSCLHVTFLLSIDVIPLYEGESKVIRETLLLIINGKDA